MNYSYFGTSFAPMFVTGKLYGENHEQSEDPGLDRCAGAVEI